MSYIKLLSLRIQKFLYTKLLNKWIYKNLPFEIAYTDIQDSYQLPKGQVLSEFDCNNSHYCIYIPYKELL